ncbi:MAG TPA: hypothetical protein VMO26_19615 [Vicinamibacterales bacterium]|nr:hypothetical protein [Vicinamibacterales bacterium]
MGDAARRSLAALRRARRGRRQSYLHRYDNRPSEAAIHVGFHGGTGRFGGATGKGVISVWVTPASPGALLAAEAGTFTGWVGKSPPSLTIVCHVD